MDTSVKRANRWLWLTIPIAILLAVATAGRLFIQGLYRDTPSLVAQAIGQDSITLVVALPTLIIGALLIRRDSQRTRLVWHTICLGYVRDPGRHLREQPTGVAEETRIPQQKALSLDC